MTALNNTEMDWTWYAHCSCRLITTNYEQLIILQEKFRDKNFQVLAFPTSDFHQELSSNEEIQQYLTKNFPLLNFPIFALSTLEDNLVYQRLVKQQQEQEEEEEKGAGGGGRVRHNFFKYLVDRNGMVVHLYTKKEDPLTLSDDIEKLLQGDDDTRRRHQVVTH